MKKPKLNKIEIVNEPAAVHTLSHDGRGIATVNSKTTFIAGALPDESVTYKITRKRSSHHEAEIIDFTNASAQRVTPPCEHFGVCGGCSLQHMSLDAQVELKQKTVLEQLKHFGQVEAEEIMPPLSANSTGYRRKARLGAKFVFKKNKLLVGFREKSSRYLADLSRCAVLHPAVGEELETLGNLINNLSINQEIPQVEVAIGDTTKALVFRHLKDLTDTDKETLSSFGKQHDFQIYLQPNKPDPLYKLWPSDGYERLTYTLPDQNLEFEFHPLDFTQVNLEINRLMVNQALEQLDLTPEDRVLDLFCGIGNFTLPIARYAKHVTGVEGAEEMTLRASDNARRNNIENVDFHVANLMEPPAAKWLQTSYEKVLLDPPRAGAKEIIPHIVNLGADTIVYVSCNPATLARDAGELVNEHKYKLQKIGIMNMFPHTSHIEAMAVFKKPT